MTTYQHRLPAQTVEDEAAQQRSQSRAEIQEEDVYAHRDATLMQEELQDVVSISSPSPLSPYSATHHIRDRHFHHRKRRRPNKPEQQPIRNPLPISLRLRCPQYDARHRYRSSDIHRTFPQSECKWLQQQRPESDGKVGESGAGVELFEGETGGFAEGDEDREERRGGERCGEGIP